MSRPDLYIVDVRPVMDNFARFRGLYDIFQRFPLSEIIETLLSIPSDLESLYVLQDVTYERFSDSNDQIDAEALVLLYEHISMELFNFLNSRIRTDERYLFMSWADQTSVILKCQRY